MRGTRSRRNFRSGRSGTETEIDFGPPAPEHREGQPGKWPVHFRQVLPTWRENEKKIKNLLKFIHLASNETPVGSNFAKNSSRKDREIKFPRTLLGSEYQRPFSQSRNDLSTKS